MYYMHCLFYVYKLQWGRFTGKRITSSIYWKYISVWKFANHEAYWALDWNVIRLEPCAFIYIYIWTWHDQRIANYAVFDGLNPIFNLEMALRYNIYLLKLSGVCIKFFRYVSLIGNSMLFNKSIVLFMLNIL